MSMIAGMKMKDGSAHTGVMKKMASLEHGVLAMVTSHSLEITFVVKDGETWPRPLANVNTMMRAGTVQEKKKV